jgi:hypothetical protein
MLAGAVNERYIRRVSRTVRGDMAHRVRALLIAAKPAGDVPMPARLKPTCRNDLCRSIVPAGAAFCPRCGTRAGERNDKVA